MIKFNYKKITEHRLFKVSTLLFFGQTIASLLLVLTSIFTAKYLGFEKYGIITLSLTYIAIINVIFNFQSFNAVIKFGHDALYNKDIIKLKSYIKQAFLQDLITAIFSYVFCITLINFVSGYIGWDDEVVAIVYILSFSILFNVSGSVTGLIRLYDKVNYITLVNLVNAFLKVVLTIIGVVMELDFLFFIIIELVFLIGTSVFTLILGFIILKRHKLLDFIFQKNNWDREFLSFNIYNNIVTTLDLPVGEFTKVFVNQLLGTAELGVYNILTKIGNIIFRLTDPIIILLYPELSKYVASKNTSKAILVTKNIVKYSFVVGGVFLIVQWMFSSIWVKLIFDETLNPNVVTFYFFYSIFCASTMGIHQLFIALNFVKFNVPIILSVNLLYILIMPFLISSYGLVGLIFSLFIQALTVIVLKLFTIYVKMKRGNNYNHLNI